MVTVYQNFSKISSFWHSFTIIYFYKPEKYILFFFLIQKNLAHPYVLTYGMASVEIFFIGSGGFESVVDPDAEGDGQHPEEHQVVID